MALAYSPNPLTTPPLLDKLLRTGAPSGYEAPAAEVWREAASFADVSVDGIGSTIARGGEGLPVGAGGGVVWGGCGCHKTTTTPPHHTHQGGGFFFSRPPGGGGGPPEIPRRP